MHEQKRVDFGSMDINDIDRPNCRPIGTSSIAAAYQSFNRYNLAIWGVEGGRWISIVLLFFEWAQTPIQLPINTVFSTCLTNPTTAHVKHTCILPKFHHQKNNF